MQSITTNFKGVFKINKMSPNQEMKKGNSQTYLCVAAELLLMHIAAAELQLTAELLVH